MGCFLSSTKRSPQNPTSTSPPQTKQSRSPLVEEETVVKEVLSEIIQPKPTIPTREIIVDDEFSISAFEPRQKYPPHHQSVVNPKDHDRMGSDTKEAVKELISRGVRVGSDPREVGAQAAKCRSSSPARRSELSPGNSGGLSRKENNGESSFRRAVVMCGENDGTRKSISRCPSARSGKSPRRVRSELGDRRQMRVQSYKGGRNNESLQNPLVSMECFIFL